LSCSTDPVVALMACIFLPAYTCEAQIRAAAAKTAILAFLLDHLYAHNTVVSGTAILANYLLASFAA